MRKPKKGAGVAGTGTAPTNKKFSIEVFEALAEDLKEGRIPLDRITLSDNIQSGLRVIIRKAGGISFHVNYTVEDSRPYLKIGEWPGTTIAEAREIAKTVIFLGEHGIDPQAGLHDRLVRELKKHGTRWRPDKTGD